MTQSASTVPGHDDRRFAFGKNWQQFLRCLTEERIEAAVRSVQALLHRESLAGLTFLDVGCGSGLFSLAARRLGATVRSFDYDADSVICCQELKRRFFPDDPAWIIERGSALDEAYLQSLGAFDIVYSWGVLHHTGRMWDAIAVICRNVSPNGQLALSLYNDQGGASRRWRFIKRTYNSVPGWLKFLIVLAVGLWTETRQALIRLIRLQNPLPFREWSRRREERGMSFWHDLVDWVGGYPFEVARPEEVFRFLRDRGFTLSELATQGCGYGCNEYVFLRRVDETQRPDA